MLNLGDTAPDFSGTAAGGSTFTLSDYAGQNHVVLYFYIKDFTAG
jgi:peroxiredoxin Q/BCP